jgi:multisubunit Na+/H+ antiporter MnhE subunit
MDNKQSTSFFDESYRKNTRLRIANFFNNLLRKTNISPKILSFVIKSWHFTFPYTTLVIYLFASLWVSYIIMFILLIFCGLFIYLKGCFVSNLEILLDSENPINIIDPYLEMCDIDINSENRYNATVLLAISYCLMVFFIFYIRLKWKALTNESLLISRK